MTTNQKLTVQRVLRAGIAQAAGLLLLTIAAAAPALADGSDAVVHHGRYFAALSGGQEVPAISTQGRGKATFGLRPSVSAAADGAAIDYAVGWADLEGDVVQAHIHLGARGTNGGVIAFLCSNLNSTPLGVPLCPQRGVVTGRIGADAIIGPDGQGIAPGELAEALRALREGLVYVNVHTSRFPGGEIRGQVHRRYGTIDPHLDPTVNDVDTFLGGGITDVQGR